MVAGKRGQCRIVGGKGAKNEKDVERVRKIFKRKKIRNECRKI